MTVNKITNAGKTTLQVEGRVDTVTAPELEKAVNAAAEDTDTLVLDCEKLVYISSAGLRVLLSTHKLMTKKKGTFELINILHHRICPDTQHQVKSIYKIGVWRKHNGFM